MIDVPYGTNTTSRGAMTLCKGTGENRRTGAIYPVRRFSTTTSGKGDTMKWTENTYRSAKKRSRKVKKKVLREERRRVEKRPLSRLQTGNGHSVQTRCRKTSRKLSDGSYFIDLYS